MASKRMFTVEQFELVRRLRNSGVTCQQIIEAFQAFERIDADLGSLYANPVPSNSPSHCLPVKRASCVSGLQPSVGPVPYSQSGGKGSPGTPGGAHLPKATNGGTATTPEIRCSSSAPDSYSSTDSNKCSSSNGNNSISNSNSSIGNSSHIDNSVSSSSRTASFSVKSEPALLEFDTEKCTEILLSQPPDTVMELIRRCVISLPDFNPTQVSSIPGMTETSLTHVLSGDFQALDLTVKYKVLDWFIFHLRRTDWFHSELSLMLRMQEPEGLGVHFTPRRERFMFREKHLEVLETFFKKVQYPTPEEKEHIANECNLAMAASRDRELGEKEKMTPFNVSNWFSNRRKEIKRLAKIGGIETEKVILPSRVKAKPINYLPTFNDLMTEQSQRVFGNPPDHKMLASMYNGPVPPDTYTAALLQAHAMSHSSSEPPTSLTLAPPTSLPMVPSTSLSTVTDPSTSLPVTFPYPQLVEQPAISMDNNSSCENSSNNSVQSLGCSNNNGQLSAPTQSVKPELDTSDEEEESQLPFSSGNAGLKIKMEVST